jgi:hypothetical protein
VSVQVEALSVDGVHDFKTEIEKLMEGLTSRRLIWKAMKVDIKVADNENGRVGERR